VQESPKPPDRFQTHSPTSLTEAKVGTSKDTRILVYGTGIDTAYCGYFSTLSLSQLWRDDSRVQASPLLENGPRQNLSNTRVQQTNSNECTSTFETSIAMRVRQDILQYCKRRCFNDMLSASTSGTALLSMRSKTRV
jgi:hypothetical protein